MSARLRSPLGRWSELPADTLPVNFSAHSVDRYAERVRPTLPRDRVPHELSMLLAGAKVVRQPPAWLTPSDHAARAPAYLLFGDVAMPLWPNDRDELVAATALPRHLSSDDRHRGRNRARRERRAAQRRARRPLDSTRPGPQADEFDD